MRAPKPKAKINEKRGCKPSPSPIKLRNQLQTKPNIKEKGSNPNPIDGENGLKTSPNLAKYGSKLESTDPLIFVFQKILHFVDTSLFTTMEYAKQCNQLPVFYDRNEIVIMVII